MPRLPKAKARAVDAAPEREEFPVLEPGVYRAKLLSVDLKKGRNGPMWECVFQTVKPKVKVWENISLGETSEWKMKQFFDAFGVPSTTDTDELLGEEILLELTVGTRQAGKNIGKERNEVYAMLPLDSDSTVEEADVEEEDDLEEALEEEDDDLEDDEDLEDDDELEEDDEEEDDEEEPPPPPATRPKAARAPRSKSASKASGSAAPTPAPAATSPKRASASGAASRTTRSTRTR